MKKLRRLALPVVVLMGMAVSARAQEADAPVPFLRCSVASFDAVNKLIAELEIPVPNMKPQLEGMFPFLGPDSVSADRPMGLVMLISDAMPVGRSESVVFAIPVAEGKAT